ncbi:DUF4189 domain-containing protein [Actinomadura sp. BRA 177]|uniref:DUF4189 domain-containing protein n=1 Tax=Actinomadura sp. BRA 177 TaxID=2745202 RepID=UPI001595E15E|nr:DUF4189 domain-containing protein [Actinomadura sp. BRA 177]NVI89401.1 DUF4189 domain-containing protein [Actinomadura sp. BRA 177]
MIFRISTSSGDSACTHHHDRRTAAAHPRSGRPPGPRPRGGGNAMVIVIVAVTAFMVLIGGGVFLLSGDDSDDDPQIRPLAATPTDSDRPTRPTYSPPSLPTSEPTTREPTYSPPPRNYGAIAVGRNGAIGKAWDYKSVATARRRALNECKTSGCKVLTTFVNGCGAVAYNSRTNRYWDGHGDTRAAAQRNAISNAGGGRTVTWVCTTR